MPYPYGMQSAPAVGNGLGGLPRRQADPKEPLIFEYLSKLSATATSHSFKIPSGYSRMRITIFGRGSEDSAVAGSSYGGGKAVSPVMQAISGQIVDINFGVKGQASGSRVSTGSLVMTVTDGSMSAGGTGSGGESNFTGTVFGVGGITDSSSVDMGSKSGSDGSNAYNGGSAPGAPGTYYTMSGSNVTQSGGRAMVRIIIW